jgi:tetratricopeptide (TPR) repeat protein
MDVNVSTVPQGYREVPEEDRKKALVFFGYARNAAGTGNYDYAIEMYLHGLAHDPDLVSAHQELREIAMKRKVSGGKSLGMMEAMKLKRPSKDDKQNMLAFEKLLAYDPGNTDYMLNLMLNSYRAGYFDTVMWMGAILLKANADSPKPEFSKFVNLKDMYKNLEQWKLASDAANYALRMHPEDMDMQAEVKNLGAQHTMTEGKYTEKGSFRDSIKDMGAQQKLFDQDKNIQTTDVMARMVADAEEEFKQQPDDPGKLNKLLDILEKSDTPEYEDRAIDLLEKVFEKTKQFRYRQRIGRINMRKMLRMERTKRQSVQADPTNDEIKKEYQQFRREQLEFELSEYQLWVDNYPTDSSFRFELAKRFFALGKFDDAIPLFQHVRNDPKYKPEGSVFLGRAFLEANYLDEADETLDGIIKEYALRGNDLSKEMYYWRGRTLELKNQLQDAIKLYSQVTQWDFNYKDVQHRVKRLRQSLQAQPPPESAAE